MVHDLLRPGMQHAAEIAKVGLARLWRLMHEVLVVVVNDFVSKCPSCACIAVHQCVCVSVSAVGFLGQVSQQWLGQNSTKSLLK